MWRYKTLIIYERFYEGESEVKKGEKLRVTFIEMIAIPEQNGHVPEKRGYYFRGDFEYVHKTGEVLHQVHGKYAKKNYDKASGWNWYWHEGSLKSLSVFVQELDGYKPICSEHSGILYNQIEKLERLEKLCTR